MHPSGLITALATPFDEAGALDLDAWRRLLEWQLAAGAQGVVVAGSTGEASMLDDGEYDTLLRAAVKTVAGRVPVLAGTGLPGTARTIAQTRRAAACGADAALVVAPAYVRPTQAGLLAHYRAVAEQGGLPVILYNVPVRTACDLLPETVVELATHERIIGIKEAVSDPARMAALVALRGPGFSVLSGDDGSAGRAMLAGADGLVSVGSNAAPAAYRHLCDLARGDDAAAAGEWDARLAPLHAFCGVEPNPIPVKALLQRRGYGQGLRLPLLPLSAPHQAEAARIAALVCDLEEKCGRESVAA
ncbi:4-hydroxy-tetrahydrodipicolinate synthase [Pseudoxanthomonas broegbernensis]|uniref:4-hydroxy-tetrahydrodipicolinate synthase n=1 Tax=Pseudoxanthomonas broegbernensis TaxID=83619 RepID=A0A7V8GLM3_9GAMM|nr:4-hydroxy-tetrahydrodipicolinate synthase [Pseudoxanthomonas broegbernensis]KAF1685918.1 4-hydroxy-tetrahydrodipicolinate synthase [Pseudoxanthomonas broegbernensis]MBB6064148.1 4-hydroxy-tetrahydrodipicolinate synthase [Pseudoxanthomonas broegbernensis]